MRNFDKLIRSISSKATIWSFCLLTVLSFSAKGQIITLGTGTTTGPSVGLAPTSVAQRYGRVQIVYTAAEINAAGILGSRPLTSLAFNVATAANVAHTNYKVQLAHTTATNSAAHIEPSSPQEVYSATSKFFNVTGWNTLDFSAPFLWNGTDNILVDICWGQNSASGAGGNVVLYDGTVTAGSRSHGSNSSPRCGLITSQTTINAKPQVRMLFPILNVNIGPSGLAAPMASACFQGTMPAVVTIRNNDTRPMYFSAVPTTVGIRVTGADTALLSTVVNTGVLSAGDTLNVSVGNLNIVNPGNYVLKIFTGNTTDTFNLDDTLSITRLSVGAPIPTPATCNFTGFSGSNLATSFPGWREATGENFPSGITSDWTSGSFTNSAAHPNGNSARINLWLASKRAWIISPLLSATAYTRLSFDYAVGTFLGNNPTPMGSDDKVEIMVSTNCGATFSPIKTYDNSVQHPNTGKSEIISLAAYAGQDIIVGFYGTEGVVDDLEDYYFYLDEIAIKDAQPLDVQLEQLVSPAFAGCYSSNEPVSVSLKNVAYNTIDFSANPVSLIATVSGVVTANLSVVINSGTLAPDQSAIYTLGNINMLTGGTYSISVKATLLGDGDTTNNLVTGTRTSVPPLFPPQSTAFTGFTGANLTTVSTGWSEAIGMPLPTGTTSTWISSNFPNAVTSNGTGAYLSFTGSTKRDWLLAPKIVASSASALKFDYAILSGATTTPARLGTNDSVAVMISTNCGQSFFSALTFDSGTVTPSGGTTAYISLAPYAGQQVIVGFFAFEGISVRSGSPRFLIDNIEIYNIPANDLTISALVAPTTPGCVAASQTIQVRLQSLGSAVANFGTTPALIQVIKTGIGVPETLTVGVTSGTLANLQDTVITVGVGNFAASGTYTIKAIVTQPGDANTANNERTFSPITVVSPLSLPISNNFTGFTGSNLATVFPGWSEASGFPTPAGTTSNWLSGNFVNTTGHPNGTAARINLWQASKRDWIMGPKFLATSNTYMSFDISKGTYAGNAPTNMGSDDKVQVMVSTNCGFSFVPVKTFDTSSVISNTGQTETINLGSFAGQEIIVAFYATEGAVNDNEDYYFYLDQINVVNSSPIDLSVTKLLTPSGASCLGASESISVQIKNIGTQAINFATDPATVSVIISGSSAQNLSASVTTGSLAPGDSLAVFVGIASFGANGTYSISGKVKATVDLNSINDSALLKSVTVSPVVAMPIKNDFTGYNGSNLETLFPNWYEATGATLPVAGFGSWASGNFANSTTHPYGLSARINYWQSTKRDWIVGPKFVPTSNTLLTYAMAIGTFSGNSATAMGSDDKFQVMLSTNCGNSFFPIKTYGATTPIANLGQVDTVDLSAYAGVPVVLAFFATEGTVTDPEDYYLYLDQISVRSYVPNDISAFAIVNPVLTQTGCFSATEPVVVQIKNAGTTPIDLSTSPVNVSFSVVGATTTNLTSVVNTGVLGSDSIRQLSLGTVPMTSSGVYNITLVAKMAGDASAANDTLKAAVSNTPGKVLPVSVDFTGFTGANLSTLFPDWSEASGATYPTGTSSTWLSASFNNNTTHPNGTSARINLYLASKRDWIVGPKISVLPQTKLKFDVSVGTFSGHNPTAMGSDDKVQVMISTDCGTTFAPIKTYDVTSNIPNTGQTEIVDLNAYAGQDVVIAFFATEGTTDDTEDYYFYLDQILIYATPALDLALNSIQSPGLVGCLGATSPAIATIKNSGTQAINFATNPATVRFTTTGAFVDTAVVIVNTGTLAVDSVLQVNAGLLNTVAAGTYNVKAKVIMAADGFYLNDSLTQSVTKTNSVSLPIANNFTGFTGSNLATVFPGWSEGSGSTTPTGTTSNWLSGNFANTTGHPNGISARINLWQASKRNWIVGPKFVPTAQTQLTYEVAITTFTGTNYSAMGSDDAVRVMISTNCGASYMAIKTYDATSNLQPTGKKDTLDLSAYVGQDVIVAFFATEGTVDDANDYYFFLDNIQIVNNLPVDLATNSILTSGSCQGTDSLQVVAVIQNKGLQTVSNFPITAKLTHGITANLSHTYTANLAPNAIDTVYLWPKYATTGVDSVLIAVKTSHASDGFTSNDSIAKMVYFYTPPATPVASNDTAICAGQSLTLSASSASSVVWYNAADSTIGFQNNLSLGSLTSSTMYYVVATPPGSMQLYNVGPTNYSFAAGGFYAFSAGLYISAIAPVNLVSVRVFAESAGVVSFQLRSGHTTTGAIVYQSDFTVTGNPAGDVLVINQPLAVGDYTVTNTGTTIGLYRNTTGPSFPYTVPNLFSIVNGSLSNYYYFFYDMVVSTGSSAGACVSAPDSVYITVNPLPVAQLVTQTGTTTLQATPGGAVKYKWLFNGLPIADTTQTITVPAVNGFYSVQGISDKGCEGPASVPFAYVGTGLEASVQPKFSLYPNPNSGRFVLDLNSAYIGEVKIRIIDNVGRAVYVTTMGKANTSLQAEIVTNGLASGMYTISIVAGNDVITQRLTIE